MACCDGRFGFLNFLFTPSFRLFVSLLLVLIINTCIASVSSLTEFQPNELTSYISQSHEKPVCVLFTNTDLDLSSNIQDILNDLNFESNNHGVGEWHFGLFSFKKHIMFPQRKPRNYPTLRCYLAEKHYHEYKEEIKMKSIKQWLITLNKTHKKHFSDASISSINDAVMRNMTVVVLFPQDGYHMDLEESVFTQCEDFTHVHPMIVHHTAKHYKHLTELYNVKTLPSIVILHRNRKNVSNPEIEILNQVTVKFSSLLITLRSRLVPAYRLNYETFNKSRKTLDSKDYIPWIILFYNVWSDQTSSYLSTFQRSVEEFKEIGLRVRFGLFDLSHDTEHKVMNDLSKRSIQVKIPMLLIIYKDTTGALVHKRYNYVHLPTPLNMYTFISSHVPFVDKSLQPLHYDSYETHKNLKITMLYEGPYGDRCSPDSHNATDNIPRKYTIHKIEKIKTAIDIPENRDWHHKFGSEVIEKKLDKLDEIPLLTLNYWTEVIEKSHAPKHLLQGGNLFAGEVTKVAMIVFIIADCGSCRRNMPVFKDLHNAVKYTDGGSLYVVNCTKDHALCKKLDIKGFPTITAFRGLGWLTSGQCVTPVSQQMYTNYIRSDYHGVMKATSIMEWFSSASQAAVTDRQFDWSESDLVPQDKDVNLLAVLTPKSSAVIPSLSGQKQGYFPYECFRLACERLYGNVKCFSMFNNGVPREQFQSHLDAVVTKIVFSRRDQVTTTVMEAGTSLITTMENMSDEQLHKFHKPHVYNLAKDQTCEDNHAECTDIVTSFTRDHARLPVTHVTLDTFHIRDSSVDEDQAVLVVLTHPDNITEDSQFFKTLNSLAYQLYNDLAVVTLDIQQYPAWSGRFIPQGYSLSRSLNEVNEDPLHMFEYPRMCFVYKNVHNKAAFYPPLGRTRNAPWFLEEKIMHFASRFLAKARGIMTSTEDF